MKRIPTKEELIQKLLTDDDWLGRALMALNRKQTQDERQVEQTRHHNGEGFRPGKDATRGTGMANYYNRHGKLTPKQAAWWRQRTRSGKTRIEVYASQLIRIAKEEQQRKAAQQHAAAQQHGQCH